MVVELPLPDELVALSAGGLEQTLVATEQVRRMVEATMLDVIDLADQRGIYADDGHATVRQWVQTLTNCSRTEATRRVQSMRALRDLELLRTRLRAGEVGVDQVRVIAKVHANRRCTGQLPDSEQLLVDHAMQPRVRRLRGGARSGGKRWPMLMAPIVTMNEPMTTGTPSSPPSAPRSISAPIAEPPKGRCCGRSSTGSSEPSSTPTGTPPKPPTANQVTKTLLARTDRQRRADALVAIFHAAASTTPGAQAPEPVVNIIIDHKTFEEHLAHLADGRPPVTDPTEVDQRRCETTTGIPIDPADAVIAALIGHVRRVVIDGTGTVIDLGRRRRLFTGAARQAIELIHRRCGWDACDVRDTQIDHTRPWAEGGSTSPDNGGPACGRHNRIKTRGYTTHRHPDGHWTTHRPDGTPITQPRAP